MRRALRLRSRYPPPKDELGLLRVLLDAGRSTLARPVDPVIAPGVGRPSGDSLPSRGGTRIDDRGERRRGRKPKAIPIGRGRAHVLKDAGLIEAQIRLTLVAADHDRLSAVVAQPQPGVTADDDCKHPEHVRLDGGDVRDVSVAGERRSVSRRRGRERDPGHQDCNDRCAVYRSRERAGVHGRQSARSDRPNAYEAEPGGRPATAPLCCAKP